MASIQLASLLLILTTCFITIQTFANGNIKPPTVVIFGRPGSGKTTIANSVLDSLKKSCLSIDLDILITEEMKESFGRGIYPSSEERVEFITRSCDYVDRLMATMSDETTAVLVSFSFVNSDMRDVFRSRFPHSRWILVNTSSDFAAQRIASRKGHFYKGPRPASINHTEPSEWEFSDVDFDHFVLDGEGSVFENSIKVLELIATIE